MQAGFKETCGQILIAKLFKYINLLKTMKSASEAFEEIQREYEQHPEGWRMYAGFDSGSQATVYAFHGDYAWTIKYPKYGMNGLAGKVKIEEDELIRQIAEDPMSFGLRILTNRMFCVLLKRGREKVAKQLKPVSVKEVQEGAKDENNHGFMTGPFTSVQSPIAPISKSQRDLEKKLTHDLEYLTDGMYG